MNRYLTIISVDDDTTSFFIPDLPGFTAQVETRDTRAALREAEDVLADFTGIMIDRGQELPDPSNLFDAEAVQHVRDQVDPDARNTSLVLLTARPRAAQPTRVNVSMDTATLARIDENAAARGLTRSAYLAEAALAYD